MKLNNFTLLYVEDEKATQVELQEILKDYVKELYVASDGEEGLALYKYRKPDIVLTDINMPNMTGIEMSKEIKKINPLQHIVLLTAFNDSTNLLEAINIGVCNYILKPVIDIKVLFKTLDAIAKVLQNDIDIAEMNTLIQTQHKVTAVSEMISNIAHQWRQPLSSISTQASTILIKNDMGTCDSETLIENMNNIISQTQELSTTIDDFRLFFRDDESCKHTFNVKDIIEDIIKSNTAIFKDRNINIISNLDDLIIDQDSKKFKQALLSILNNARDAFDENTADNQRHFFIEMNSKDKNTITFKDTAGGIDKELLNKVFLPYTSTKFQSRGTGLGLYMSNQIITNTFNGSIYATNEEFSYDGVNYKGACFTIEL